MSWFERVCHASDLDIERKNDKGAGNVARKKKKGRNSRENEVKSGRRWLDGRWIILSNEEGQPVVSTQRREAKREQVKTFAANAETGETRIGRVERRLRRRGCQNDG